VHQGSGEKEGKRGKKWILRRSPVPEGEKEAKVRRKRGGEKRKPLGLHAWNLSIRKEKGKEGENFGSPIARSRQKKGGTRGRGMITRKRKGKKPLTFFFCASQKKKKRTRGSGGYSVEC